MSRYPGRTALLDITVFVCGAVVMIFEITGSRVLSPFIGASTYVWTSLIGVILGSLSLGYFIGGRVADRRQDLGILSTVILCAAGLIATTVIVKEIVLSALTTTPLGIELRSVAAALLLFAPASACLGFVTPYCVRLRIASLEFAGETVGRLYALSTLGSIVGTFAAGFVLIPFVGSIRTLYALAAVLIVLGLLLAALRISRLSISVIVVVCLAILINESLTYYLLASRGLYDIDTEYSRVQVFETIDPGTQRPIKALTTDPYFTQSAMFLDDAVEPVFDYSRYYHLARYIKPEFKSVLVIGGAGYSMPKDFLDRYSGISIDVVEIDPGMTAIARRHFKLTDDPRLRIFHEDGRTFLRNSPQDRYDIIMMDAFGSLFSVPYQLTTVEAAKEMRRVLRDDGAVIFNLGSAISGEGSGFLTAELKTYSAAFESVQLFKVKPAYSDDRLQNLIILASSTAAAAREATADVEIRQLLRQNYPLPETSNAPLLTDDLAPVEYFNARSQNVFLNRR